MNREEHLRAVLIVIKKIADKALSETTLMLPGTRQALRDISDLAAPHVHAKDGVGPV